VYEGHPLAFVEEATTPPPAPPRGAVDLDFIRPDHARLARHEDLDEARPSRRAPPQDRPAHRAAGIAALVDPGSFTGTTPWWRRAAGATAWTS
jgi:hypothetical protein